MCLSDLYASVRVNYNLKSCYSTTFMENSRKTIIRIQLHILKESSYFFFFWIWNFNLFGSSQSPKFNDCWLKLFSFSLLLICCKIIKTMLGWTAFFTLNVLKFSIFFVCHVCHWKQTFSSKKKKTERKIMFAFSLFKVFIASQRAYMHWVFKLKYKESHFEIDFR